MTTVGDAHTHSHPDNPVVFFDVSIGGIDAGRIKSACCPRSRDPHRRLLTSRRSFFSGAVQGRHAENSRELQACRGPADVCPVLSFLTSGWRRVPCRQFCTGEFKKGMQPTGYKDCRFHRIIKGFMVRLAICLRGSPGPWLTPRATPPPADPGR